MQYAEAIRQSIAKQLPSNFKGFSCDFGAHGDDGTQTCQKSDTMQNKGFVQNHRVEILDLSSYIKAFIGIDIEKQVNNTYEFSFADWLSFPQQKLLGLTKGAVFYDGLGELTRVCQLFFHKFCEL